MARYFSRLRAMSAAPSWPASPASARATASPTAAIAIAGSRWAPPSGSATTVSTRRSVRRSSAVSRSASAASGACAASRAQDGGAALRGDHGVDCVLQHQHPVRRGEGDSAAGAALADDGGHHRHRRLQAGLDGAGDGLGLAPRLGVDAREGAGGVHEGEHRQPEAPSQFEQPAGLAVALGPGHAEIVLHPALGVAALLRADHHHGAAAEAPEATHHRLVFGERTIAGERRVIGDQGAEIGQRLRPVRVARDLRLLPRRQARVGDAQLPVGLVGQPADLLGDVDAARLLHLPKLLDLALELGDGFLEVQVRSHGGLL